MRLKEYIQKAREEKTAIGHFNVSDLAGIKAITQGARECGTPVIIGVSEGERDFIGVRHIVALVESIRSQYNQDIFINADHTHSFEKVKEAVEAGFDAVLFDGGARTIEENIALTKEVVDWVGQYCATHNKEVLVEGELGYIGSGSVILDRIPDGVSIRPEDLTKPQDARYFIEQTGVDLLAPAVGNIHGMFEHVQNPNLDINRIKEISGQTNIPLVLHGASGNSAKDIINAIAFGVSVIHINTELRVAWKRGLDMALLSHPNEIAPYKLLPEVVHQMQKVVEDKIRLYSTPHQNEIENIQ